MAPWIESLIVGLIVGAAVLLLARRLFASFGSKKCGCDSCPTAKTPAKTAPLPNAEHHDGNSEFRSSV